MDMLGHCEVALRSGLHSHEDIYGEGLIDLMLPNMLHCHDWAYANMWTIDEFPAELGAAPSLIRSHIVADWVIHYGKNDTTIKKKCGWAYQRMAAAKKTANTFFANAKSKNLLFANTALPINWTKREHLDFSHSIIEYSIDVLLADGLGAAEFSSMRKVLSRLGISGGSLHKRLYRTFELLKATSDQDMPFLDRSVGGLVQDAALADRPDYFAISTVIRKYGFKDSPDSYKYVRQYLENIARDLDVHDVRTMLNDVSATISNPQAIFSGALGSLTGEEAR